MTAIKLIHELVNNAIAIFHGPVDETSHGQQNQQPQAPLVSLYGKCVKFGCKQANIRRGTNCQACGTLRPER